MINVFTRFNVKDPNWPEYDKSGNDVLTSEWLEERIELFTKYTVPSMRWQKQAVKWHLLFDPDTDWRITQQMPKEAIIHHTATWQECIDSNIGILNVRLDNDDMLLPGALHAISQAAKGRKEKAYYVLTQGFKLDYHSGMLDPYNWRGSNFVARSYGNPYADSHGRGVESSGLPVYHITGRHWVQVIHERNVRNS